jgi:metal-responsive CopG/Arc/MetJ family transcriptional regulator
MSQKRPKSNRRGALKQEDSVFVGAWVPTEIADILDREVQAQDSDRSKIIRAALRRHLVRRTA